MPSFSTDDWVSQVYEDLRLLARSKIASEKSGYTLQPTALVNEVYLKLAKSSQEWKDRDHFLRAAAITMQRILVDRARHKLSVKGGGGFQRHDIEADEISALAPPQEIVDVDEALEKLNLEEPQAAHFVRLVYFLGFSKEDASQEMKLSLDEGKSLWKKARSYLKQAISQAKDN
jgi:RNA polymerase sigma factor (TIGR02999 family)